MTDYNDSNKRKIWTYHETKALLECYTKRKLEMDTTKNKKGVYMKILADLKAINVLENPYTTDEMLDSKIRSLLRAFKACYDNNAEIAPSIAPFMDQLVYLFGDRVGSEERLNDETTITIKRHRPNPPPPQTNYQYYQEDSNDYSNDCGLQPIVSINEEPDGSVMLDDESDGYYDDGGGENDDDFDDGEDDDDRPNISDNLLVSMDEMNDEQSSSPRRTWTVSETLALINSYIKRKTEMDTSKNKRNVYQNILDDLNAHRKLKRPATASMLENKMKSLLRAYRTSVFVNKEIAPCLIPCLKQIEYIFNERLQYGDQSYDYQYQDMPPVVAQLQENGNYMAEEEIIDENEKSQRRTWTENETWALLNCYENRKAEMLSSKNRKFVYEDILQDLISINALEKPATIAMLDNKIKSLLKAFKAHLLFNKEPAPCIVPFMTQMESIFGDQYTDSRNEGPSSPPPPPVLPPPTPPTPAKAKRKFIEPPAEIIVKEEPQDPDEFDTTSDEFQRRQWTHNETSSLLNCFERRKDEMASSKSKKAVYDKILEDLIAENCLESPTTTSMIENKIKGLLRAYRKSLRNKNLKPVPCVIPFMKQMHDIFDVENYEDQSTHNGHSMDQSYNSTTNEYGVNETYPDASKNEDISISTDFANIQTTLNMGEGSSVEPLDYLTIIQVPRKMPERTAAKPTTRSSTSLQTSKNSAIINKQLLLDRKIEWKREKEASKTKRLMKKLNMIKKIEKNKMKRFRLYLADKNRRHQELKRLHQQLMGKCLDDNYFEQMDVDDNVEYFINGTSAQTDKSTLNVTKRNYQQQLPKTNFEIKSSAIIVQENLDSNERVTADKSDLKYTDLTQPKTSIVDEAAKNKPAATGSNN